MTLENKLPKAVQQVFVEELGELTLNLVFASSNPLNRYSVREGRIYGSPSNTRDRYRIVDVSGDRIVYRDLKDHSVRSGEITKILEDWNKRGVKEVSDTNKILEWINKNLSPLLGGVLVAALIAWLQGKLK